MSDVDLSVDGDNDSWMLLDRLSAEDLPLIVRSRVNPTITDFAKANRVAAVIFDIRPEHVREDGLPTCLDDLHRLEDLIVEAVAASGVPAFHTASVTGDGRRVQYFATDKALDVVAVINPISSGLGALSVYTDFDFETYRDFITPTPLDKQFNGDRGVIANLEQHGDDGTVARKPEPEPIAVPPAKSHLSKLFGAKKN